MVLLGIVRNKEIDTVTYEECLEICTKRMCVFGYFPAEIAAAATNTIGYALEDKDKTVAEYAHIYLSLP